MRREIKEVKLERNVSGCCPGHDDYPVETYKNRRSKKARSRDKKKEHRYVRRVLNRSIEVDSFNQGE